MPKIKKKVYNVKDHQEQEIVTLMNKIASVLSGYTKQLMIAAVALVVVLVIMAGYSLMLSSQEQKAAPLFAVAYEYYSPAGGMGADYQKALGLFRDIVKKYPGAKSGAVSQYYVGNCLANLGQTEEALKEYQSFIKNHGGEKTVLGLVYQRMGYLYGALGKKEEAVKAFEQAEAVGGPGVATFELARLYEASGNMTESQKKYKVVEEKLGGTSWGIEAMGKVQKIAPAVQPDAGKAK